MKYEEKLRSKIKNLPLLPGVYKFFNAQNEIVYVGKAKALRKRVTSYFTKSHQKDPKTRRLVGEIRDLTYTVVNTETDALLLENNLIKINQPKYNILLKDGKSYPYICIMKEDFPRVFSTRHTTRKADYYGPYTNNRTLAALLELTKKLYTVRTCQFNLSPKNVEQKKVKLCLEYHIKNCKGPCQGLQTAEDYGKDIEQIRNILSGKISLAKNFFKEEMQEAAANLDFEMAQRYKEKHHALKVYQSKSVVTNPKIVDLEVFSVFSDEKKVYINYLKIENGCIIRAQNDAFTKKLNETEVEILTHAILNFRKTFDSQTTKIISNIELENIIPEVESSVPQRGDFKKLVDLSLKNVFLFHKEQLRIQKDFQEKKDNPKILEILQKDLNMKNLPRHIECFDNSNLHGTNPVASMVCFKDGKPSKRNYRKFNIKTVVGIDDFASMNEVVYRRYKRLLDQDMPLPNLVVVDGGKGQLSSACQALKELNIYGKITIIGIAKRLEEIYYPEDSFPLYINKKSPSLKLLQHLRNEAHRFAITFHRDQRSKNSIINPLIHIKGIGEKTSEKLLIKYKSVNNIKKAPQEELYELIGKQKTAILLKGI
jgi:excinuclease ABC subunit C